MNDNMITRNIIKGERYEQEVEFLANQAESLLIVATDPKLSLGAKGLYLKLCANNCYLETTEADELFVNELMLANYIESGEADADS